MTLFRAAPLGLSLVLPLAFLLGCPPKQPPETPVDPAATAQGGLGAQPGGAEVLVVGETPSGRVERLSRQSVEDIQSGDPARLRKAVEDLTLLSTLAPDQAAVPFNMGVAYERLGDTTSARKSYLRATDIDPAMGDAWQNLGALSEQEGDLTRAMQSYEAGLRGDPDHPGLVTGVISVLRKQGKYAQAVEKARAALGQNSNNLGIYNNLGLVYLDQGQVDLASFVYQKALNAIEGADQNASLHSNLGKVYLAKDQRFLARQEFERALALDPSLVSAMLSIADLHLDDRNWTDAATLLERARELDRNNAAILINLGIAYRGMGRLEEAQSLYEKALELDATNADPYLNLALLQGDHMRAYDAALASVDRYVAAGGKRTELAQQWRADLEASKTRYEKDLDRQRKREEREKKRLEEERLAAEYEASQATARAAADAARGQACPSDGCPTGLACNRVQVCVDEGSAGTAVAGAACTADADCSFGLLCGADAVCQPGAGSDAGGGTPPPALPMPAVPPDAGAAERPVEPPPPPADGEPQWGGQ